MKNSSFAERWCFEIQYKDVILRETVNFFDVDDLLRHKDKPAMRIMAFLMQKLRDNRSSGNTNMLLKNLFVEFRVFFADKNYSKKIFIKSLLCLKENGLIAIKGEFIGLKDDYLIEKSIDSHIRNHLKDTGYDPHRVISEVEEINDTLKFPLGKQQKEAVIQSAMTNFFVLLGGPGTGKSTTLKTILQVQEKLCGKLRIALLAPTGAAAKRMSECCGLPAYTIQSWLKAITEELPDGELKINGYKYNNDNKKNDVDLVVVDETSMVDTKTMKNLLEALKDETRILFLGDPNQLPSVDAGNCLSDIEGALTGTLHLYKLTETYRQKGESLIKDNADKIVKGAYDFKFGNDFVMIRCKKEDLFETVYNYAHKSVCFGEGMILSGLKKNKETGTNELNKFFQKRNYYAEASEQCFSINAEQFFLNDRVMFTKNTKKVKNGDIGTVTEIDDSGTVNITLDTGEILGFKKGDPELRTIELAYAITVHKSQGQEANIVTVVLDKGQSRVLNRNLLFTAITRAKKKVYLIVPNENNGLLKTIVRKTIIRSTWLLNMLKTDISD